MNRMTKLMAAAGCCLMIASGALAQTGVDKAKDAAKDAAKGAHDAMDKMDPKMAAEVEAWVKANQPGEMHQVLAKFAGEWNCVVKHFNPDGTSMDAKGTCTTTPMFDGRFFQCDFKSEMMGMPFKGQALMGYNNAAEQFECTWADSMSTGIMFMNGSWESASKTLTLKGECICPMTKKPKWMKEVITWTNDNTYVSTFTGPDDNGKEMKMMEITYTRAAAKPAAAANDEAKKKMAEMEKRAADAAKNPTLKK